MQNDDEMMAAIDAELEAYKRGEVELRYDERFSGQQRFWLGNQDVVTVLGMLPAQKIIAVIRDRDGVVTATSLFFCAITTTSLFR